VTIETIIERARLRPHYGQEGGDTTAADLPVTVGALARLPFAKELEKEVVQPARQGWTDERIAERLTREGFRSPRCPTVLPSTVQIIRLRHRLFVTRSQSHPRRIPGYLTVPQLAEKSNVSPHWIYDRIHNGTIQVVKDPEWRLYLFPDRPATLARLRQLREGKVKNLRF
jgi:hypothetical protein